jgi:hypothetical protein
LYMSSAAVSEITETWCLFKISISSKFITSWTDGHRCKGYCMPEQPPLLPPLWTGCCSARTVDLHWGGAPTDFSRPNIYKY